MAEFPKILAFGDRGILIEFGGDINEDTLEKVLFYKKIIEDLKFKEKVEVINTYNSLLISYMFTIEDVYSEFLRVEKAIGEANISKITNYRIFHIPVCYHKEFGLDLEYISGANDLTQDEIIQLHTAPTYRVYFIGFLPGFLYLGGLDEKLKISRKQTPRKLVEKGSVGIGENQTGIYPKNSPGGWQILGKSPVNLFDKNEADPSPFLAGDKIKFVAVSKEEYFEIENQIEKGTYKLKIEDNES